MKKWFFIALFVVVITMIAGVAWSALRRQLRGMVTLTGFKSYTDEFHVTVLELKSAPNSFEEHVRVKCEKDMEVGIEVVDLKETGMHELQDSNGSTFYQPGNPYKAGQSEPINGTCEILYTVNTTSTNTIWHSKISMSTTNTFSHSEDSGGVDTTLRPAMTINGIQTNWPDAYKRGSWIPLATLGNYKVVLIAK